ncbi:MAG: DUF4349 domain-containing protein [Planctomycetota bacterium]
MDIHASINEWLAAASAGGLSAEERGKFEAHLAGCPECRKIHEEERVMTAAVEGVLRPDRPEGDFEERMVKGFRRGILRKGFFREGWRKFIGNRVVHFASAAAALVALVQIGGSLTGEKSGISLWSAPESFEKPDRTLIVTACEVTENNASGGEDKDSGEPVLDVEKLSESSTRGRSMPSSQSYGGLAAKPSAPPPGPAGGARLEKEQRSADGEDMLREADGKAENLRRKEFRGDGQLAEANKADRRSSKKAESATRASSPVLKDAAAAERQAVESPKPPDARKVIRNATLEFEVENYDASVERIIGIVQEERGFVATTNASRLANGKVRGEVVVKLPPENLEKFLLKMRALGDLKNQALTSQDVTKYYFDTDSRLRNARKMEERLLDMLEKVKGKVSELLEVEKEMARVRGEIEQMQGEIKYMDAMIAHATVTIVLYEKDMNQPAAYLLKDKVNLSLFSADVEKAHQEAKRLAEAAKAQILQSNLKKDANGRITATLSVLVEPEGAEALISNFRELGRESTLTRESERVAQDGSGSSDTAKVKKDKVTINLAIVHDDEARQQASLTVVTKAVEEAFDRIKKEAASRGAEVVTSKLDRDGQGEAAGNLVIRVSGKEYPAFLGVAKGIGRVSEYSVQRRDRAGKDAEKEEVPVLLAITLTRNEDTLQWSNLLIQSDEVEKALAEAKGFAGQKGAEILSSNFERARNGQETGTLHVRLPVKDAETFVPNLKGLGKVKDYTVKRQDRPNAVAADDGAPAEISLVVQSKESLIAEDSGFVATLRKTISQSAEGVMRSVRHIVVAIAWLGPWLAAIALAWWFLRRRKKGGTTETRN